MTGRRALSAATALLVAACCSQPSREEVPARLVEPGSAGRAELQRVVSQALSAEDVLLANDALTDSSWLIVERRRIRRLDNVPANGRDLGMPERFHLLRSGRECTLVHERSGRRYVLRGMRCRPE